MLHDAFELAPGEVATDRYDPYDEATRNSQPEATLTPAELAALLELAPWY